MPPDFLKCEYLLRDFVYPGTLIGRSPLYSGTCPALDVQKIASRVGSPAAFRIGNQI